MDNIILCLFVLCIVGIYYAGHLYDTGRIRRYMNIKWTIENKLVPAICVGLMFMILEAIIK